MPQRFCKLASCSGDEKPSLYQGLSSSLGVDRRFVGCTSSFSRMCDSCVMADTATLRA